MNTPLNVALTVEQCWQPTPGGSGTYIVELSRALGARDDVIVSGLAARHAHPAPADWTPDCDVAFSRLPRAFLYESWNRWSRPRAETTLGARPDVVHATTWAIPPTTSPLVVTVHDLAFRRSPEHFTPRGVKFFERSFERTLAEASIVITPSQVTADDCVAAGVEPGRVRVVPHGAHVAAPSPSQRADFARKHNLPERYVLWCGTREPRKNLATLLRAFAIAAEVDPGLHLVLIGPSGWLDAGTSVDIGRVADRVHMLGKVSWDELQCAYADATVFCFPSLWEGFGMPVLEAMSHGVPVVTSAGSSMAEIVGDAGVLADPLDAAEIAAGLLRAAGPDGAALAAAASHRSHRFSWDGAAELTAQAYRDAR